MVEHINHAIVPALYQKMYRMHKYWARKPSNVVSAYIEAYSAKGDVVLDPFNGSGVTVLEALKLSRKAVGVDVDPFSIFLTRATATSANIDELRETMADIIKSVAKRVERLYETICVNCHSRVPAIEMLVEDNIIRHIKYKCRHCSKKSSQKDIDGFDQQLLEKVSRRKIPYWVPDTNLIINSRINIKQPTRVVDLFSHRNLIALSIILHRINQIKDETIRMVFKLVFSTTLVQGSKLMGRTKGSGPSWKIRGFWIPPKRHELNVWHYFKNAFEKVVSGKQESNSSITNSDFGLFHNTCTNMPFLKDNSVDYIFTDPPYADSVPYLELNTFWSAWLGGDEPLFDDEIVITDSLEREDHRTFENYSKHIHSAYREMFRVLKPGKYLTVTFHNTKIEVYNLMISAALISGFDLEKSVYQPPSTVSVKAQMAPYGSAVGDYYIRFRKPESASKKNHGMPDRRIYENIVVNEVKKILAERGEPTPYTHIVNSYSYIYDALKKRGYLLTANMDIRDIIKDHVGKEFVIVQNEKKGELLWISKKHGKFLNVVSLTERVETSIINILNRHPSVSYDEILQEIYIAFPNALTPSTITIKHTLDNYAKKTPNKRWRAKTSVKAAQSEHDDLVEKICSLGVKCKFHVYGDVPKYRTGLRLNYDEDRLRRIRKIDAVWYKNRQIKVIFEVENSTNITEAIARGSNLEEGIAKIILIPEERESLLVRKVNEPMLKQWLDTDPWLFIRYGDFKKYCRATKKPDKASILKLHKSPQAPVQTKLN